jgi:predicted peptidase
VFKKLSLALLLLLVPPFAAGAQAQTPSAQQAQSFEKRITITVSGRYLLYLPKEYGQDRSKKWPMLLFLHGSGERGDDLEAVKKHGPPKLIEQGKEFPFIVVSPQCPDGEGWDSRVLNALLDEVMKKYAVDADRVYCTGLSMGGFGTWQLAEDYPDRFAAIAPICGGGNPSKAALLKNVPVWAFHGAKDPVVPIQREQDMVDALKAAGGDVKFTIYPDAGHDAWTETYNNPELYDWLLQHRRSKNPK